MNNNWLVFTDLDGTLLDHHDYSYSAAEPALALLKRQGIPIILNSSKTLAELSALADALQLQAPVIAENGSLIAIPGEPPVLWGPDYAEICALLDDLRAQYGWQFEGFHDWNLETLVRHTGLPAESAMLAAERQASEPLLWLDELKLIDDFADALRAHHLKLKRGGRFWHVMGRTDKVNAMAYLVERQTEQQGQRPHVMALGDGPNDLAMLAAADVAVIVHNPDSDPIQLSPRVGQQLIETTLPGPAGWNAAVMQIFNSEGN